MIHRPLNTLMYQVASGRNNAGQDRGGPYLFVSVMRNIRKVCKMQKSASKTWLVAGVLGLTAAVFATQALADCDDGQENAVGKAIAAAASAKISGVVPNPGKQMINLDSCDSAGGGLIADFKYNVIGSDGLYWVSGHAKVASGSVTEMKLTSLSSNLAAASAKAGVKLASN